MPATFNHPPGVARSASEAAARSLRRGLVGYWSPVATGPTGSAAFDLSGFRRNATLTNMENDADWVAGAHGYGLQMDGTAEYCRVTSNLGIEGFPLTLAAWVDTDSDSATQTILSLNDASASNRYFTIEIRGGVASIVARNATFRNAAGTTAINASSGLHLVAGAFLFNTVKDLYVDGRYEATLTDTVSFSSLVDDTLIGQLRNSSPTDYFNGRIYEAAVWDRGLAANEIAVLHSLGPGGLASRRRLTMPFFEDDGGGGANNINLLRGKLRGGLLLGGKL